jgi:hypothetical protein
MLALAALLVQPPAATKLYPPDPATAARIAELRAELDRRVAALPVPDEKDIDHRPDVLVYAKAVEWTVRYGEWYAKDSAAQTVRVLEAGIERAKELAAGRMPWQEVTGRPVIQGYRSSVDGSIQPRAVTRPAADHKVEGWQADVVLHGRDDTLTEVKFIALREAAMPTPVARWQVEPYGRGNNAYRWAGETDVDEAFGRLNFDPGRAVLRGFSMGGAGTWHLGLHHPTRFAAIQPGAGFTTTRGYVKLPADLPPHVEKCLTIYDADRAAANLSLIPAVAYSGERDKQKAAADGIERAVAALPVPVRLVHVVAPGLEHKQPPEWVARCDAELAKLVIKKSDGPRRFVTHTPRYGDAGPVRVLALERQYEPATLDFAPAAGLTVTTANVRRLSMLEPGTVDGQSLAGPPPEFHRVDYEWVNGRWGPVRPGLVKAAGTCGPIDDAFLDAFTVHPPAGPGWHPATDKLATDTFARFDREWDRFLRGKLRRAADDRMLSVALFGDPASNPLIAKHLPRLPIRWTRDELVVNGVRYDPATHLPVLIYPKGSSGYVVLNSGHTFGEAEFRGSNAQLYPRLGDWAVRKVTGEVVASGLFDENWQFPK